MNVNNVLNGGGKNPSSSRWSNMELLRIVAMFLVLVVHADYFSLGHPLFDDVSAHPVSSFFRIWTEAFSLVCVNVFVLISGYFGIRVHLKSVCALLFQVMFLMFGVYLLFVGMGWTPFSFKGLLMMLIPTRGGWFVGAYLGLMLFSPFLNSFVEHSTRQQLGGYLLAFYVVAFSLSWFHCELPMFGSGYSSVAFIGLYLLGRYVRLYPGWLAVGNKWKYLMIYLLLTVVSSIVMYAAVLTGSVRVEGVVSGLFMSYISPQTVAGSLCLLLLFTKFRFQNLSVNRIAASAFAVYIIHCHTLVIPFFRKVVQWMFTEWDTFYFIVGVTAFLIIVFVGCVLVDQLRIFVWNRISRHLLFVLEYIGGVVGEKLSLLKFHLEGVKQ